MNRRLYFLLPDLPHAEKVICALKDQHVPSADLHLYTRAGLVGENSLKPNPIMLAARDRLGGMLQRDNLTLFIVVFAVTLGLHVLGVSIWALIAVVIVLVVFVMGVLFADQIPYSDLLEFQDAAHHGEVVLMVDIPKARIQEVENIVRLTRANAVRAGVGWSMRPLHL